MVHSTESVAVAALRGNRRLTELGIPQPWITLPLLVGLVLGTVFGLFSSLPVRVSSLFELHLAGRGFFPSLWLGSAFPAAALLLATSFLGFALLPFLSATGGFLLGAGAAAVLQMKGYSGLLAALFSLGIPALFCLPAYLLAASDGAVCSFRLLRCFTRGEHRPLDAQGDGVRHIALIVFLCFLEALYSAFLLPVIMKAL